MDRSAWMPASLPVEERAVLLDGAVGVLDDNWRGDHTVPSGELYPHQWSWDTAFIAIGRSWIDQPRAQVEMQHLFAGQWANGMVPHIVFNPDVSDDAYFPGPRFWRSDTVDAGPDGIATSGITQPPLHARAALEISAHAVDRQAARGFLETLYPKLVAQHDYLKTVRDVAGDGLAAIVHPWESGMDNSPAWDHDLDDLEIPAGALPDYQRRDLAHAKAEDRPSDAAYDRFVYLAMLYRDAGYGAADLPACPFLVEDPLRDRHQHDRPGAPLGLARVLRPLRWRRLRQPQLRVDRRAHHRPARTHPPVTRSTVTSMTRSSAKAELRPSEP